MRILVLEDNEERIKYFKQGLIGYTVDYCTTAKECKERIENTIYNLIFLDHDLGGRVYVDSDEEDTGYQVAKLIPDSINKNTRVVIHTLNPQGAKRMKQAIGTNATWVPFISLKLGQEKK